MVGGFKSDWFCRYIDAVRGSIPDILLADRLPAGSGPTNRLVGDPLRAAACLVIDASDDDERARPLVKGAAGVGEGIGWPHGGHWMC
jgi:hypothetical protein